MKKFVLYAAVFGKKSRFRKPEISGLDPDMVLYTDLPRLLNEDHVFYDVKETNLDHLDSVRRNRFMKICIPDEIFHNYEYSMYMDYKHPTKINFDDMLSCLEPGSDILLNTRHYHRDCVYDEGIVCIERKKDNEKDILRQLSFYRSKGYPAHNGLYANWWLFRRHTKEMRELSKLWWTQVEKYSCRDQISLPYLEWKHGLKISVYKEKK
jgi:hypothetical protein